MSILEFWVFQPAAPEPPIRPASGWCSTWARSTRTRWRWRPDSITVTGTDTVFTGRQYVGEARLDTERSRIGIFDAQVDDNGILGDRPDSSGEGATGAPVEALPLCQRILTNAVPVFPWGDLSGAVHRGNGTLDTEDLNGDNVLNVVGAERKRLPLRREPLPGDRYFVRNGVRTRRPTSAVWKLYRIPIRTPDATIGTPNLRLIQHLRVTVVAPRRPGAARCRRPVRAGAAAAGRLALDAPGGDTDRGHLRRHRRAAAAR